MRDKIDVLKQVCCHDTMVLRRLKRFECRHSRSWFDKGYELWRLFGSLMRYLALFTMTL